MHKYGMVSSVHTKFHESLFGSCNLNMRDKHTGKDITPWAYSSSENQES
jgi:hypothetical protein